MIEPLDILQVPPVSFFKILERWSEGLPHTFVSSGTVELVNKSVKFSKLFDQLFVFRVSILQQKITGLQLVQRFNIKRVSHLRSFATVGTFRGCELTSEDITHRLVARPPNRAQTVSPFRV